MSEITKKVTGQLTDHIKKQIKRSSELKIPKSIDKFKKLDTDIKLTTVLLAIPGSLLLLYIVYLLLSILKNLFKPSYSFGALGGEFDKSWKDKYGLTDSGVGFEDGDYLDFDMHIRTRDATDDCKMKGRYTINGLENIQIKGKGPKCSKLRKNNK